MYIQKGYIFRILKLRPLNIQKTKQNERKCYKQSFQKRLILVI